MKSGRLTLVVTSMVGALLGLTLVAWGDNGQPGTGATSCLVASPGAGKQALKGTVAVEVTSNILFINAAHDIDVTLRLEGKGGSTGNPVFRLHLKWPIGDLNKEQVACLFLDPEATAVTGDPDLDGNGIPDNPDVFAFV